MNFNPRAPCGARRLHRARDLQGDRISTHAPLAGRDSSPRSTSGRSGRISTHAPLAGRDRRGGMAGEKVEDFNPRAPCEARPSPATSPRTCRQYFNPRAPCGARLRRRPHPQARNDISTHAPLAGRDGRYNTMNNDLLKFQPTRPLRGATIYPVFPLFRLFISTHAPLAGRDSKSVQITMHIFAITDKFQMLLHRMPPVRAFCSFLMQENHADFGCEPPKRSLRACASHYKIIGSSGRYVCLQPKCSILFSYFLPK